MSNDQFQARLQRIEADVRGLHEKFAVLAAVDGDAAKKRIRDTFGTNPRMVIIYRGVELSMTQEAIAKALRERNLTGATQGQVSFAVTELAELGFVERTAKGSKFVTVEGWRTFGLERVLRKTLRDEGIDDLD